MRTLSVIAVLSFISTAYADPSDCGYNDSKLATKLLGAIGKIDRAALTGALCNQSELVGENYTSTPLAYGARKVFATMFGCSALDTKLFDNANDNPLNGKVKHLNFGEYYDPRVFQNISHEEIVKLHPYLRREAEKCGFAEKCKNYSKVIEPTTCDQTHCFFYWHPPVYQRANGVHLFYQYKGGNPAAGGFDCSGAVELAMKASGLLMNPRTPVTRFTTSAIWDYMRIGDSCFEPVSILDDVRPGDILNEAGDHVVMIDTVAKDPFNIQPYIRELKAAGEPIDSYASMSAKDKDDYALEKCKDLAAPDRKSKFKFTVFQSSPQPRTKERGTQLGYQNNRAFPGGLSGTLGTGMVEKAQIMCVAEFWKLWGGGEVKKKYLKPVKTTGYEIYKDRKRPTSRIDFVACVKSEKGCKEYYESPQLNDAQGKLRGRTLHARHKLTPECRETALKNPAKAKFDPYSCADTCNLEKTYSERDRAI